MLPGVVVLPGGLALPGVVVLPGVVAVGGGCWGAGVGGHGPGGGRLLALALVLVAFGALGALLLVAPGSPLAPFGERLRALDPGSLLLARRADWGGAVATIKSHPLFGQPDAPNAYNLFLGLAAQSGLPVLGFFLALLGATWAAGRKALAGPLAPEAVGLIGSTIGLLVTGIGESTLGARLTPPAFLLLGLLAGLGAVAPSPKAGRAG